MGRKWEPIHCSHELRHIGILAFEFTNDNYHINHTKRCRCNISLYNPIRRCLINLTLTMRSRSLTFRNRAEFAILCGTQIIIIRHHLIRKNDKHTVAIGGCQLQFYFYSCEQQANAALCDAYCSYHWKVTSNILPTIFQENFPIVLEHVRVRVVLMWIHCVIAQLYHCHKEKSAAEPQLM